MWKPDGPPLYSGWRKLGPGNRVNGSHLKKPKEKYFIGLDGVTLCRYNKETYELQRRINGLWITPGQKV